MSQPPPYSNLEVSCSAGPEVYQTSPPLHQAASRINQRHSTSILHELDSLRSSNSRNQRPRSPTGTGRSQTRISELPGRSQKSPRPRGPSAAISEQTHISQDVSSAPLDQGRRRKYGQLVALKYVTLVAFMIAIAVSMCIGVFAVGKKKSGRCLILYHHFINVLAGMSASQFPLHRSL